MKPYGYPKGDPWQPGEKAELAFLVTVFLLGALAGGFGVFVCLR